MYRIEIYQGSLNGRDYYRQGEIYENLETAIVAAQRKVDEKNEQFVRVMSSVGKMVYAYPVPHNFEGNTGSACFSKT